MSTTFNMFDLIFAVSSFIFILVAFLRGFVKELFALFNWIITVTLTYLLSPYAAKLVAHYSHNKLIVNVVSGSLVFIVIFIIVALATRGLSHDWKEKMPEGLDRFLGVIYGVFKSLLIFGLIYAVITNFILTLHGSSKKHKNVLEEEIASEKAQEKEQDQAVPNWMANAKCFSLVKFSGQILKPLVDGAIKGMADNLVDEVKPKKIELDDKIDEIVDENESANDNKKGVGDEVGGSAGALTEKNASKKNDNQGYSKKEIEKMNRLIEIVK